MNNTATNTNTNSHTNSNDELFSIMDNYAITCEEAAKLLKCKKYTVYNFRSGRQRFKTTDAYFMLNRLKQQKEEQLKKITEDMTKLIV